MCKYCKDEENCNLEYSCEECQDTKLIDCPQCDGTRLTERRRGKNTTEIVCPDCDEISGKVKCPYC